VAVRPETGGFLQSSDGVNLFSWMSQEGGIGNVARQFAAALLNAQVPVRVLSLDGALPAFLEPHRGSPSLPLDRRINLFIFPMSAQKRWIPELAPRAKELGQVNVLMGFWELERFTRRQRDQIADADVFLAASDFLADLAASAAIPVVRCGIPLTLPAPAPGYREKLGLEPGQVAFITAADPGSDLLRKNPAAAVNAFALSGAAALGARLVVKLNLRGAARLTVEMRQAMSRFQELVRRIPGVLVLDEELSYAEALGLYAACDVYVSLHRAEGFGLPLLEAMLLGRPVIATAYSGNCSFMNESNACMVTCRKVPVRALHPAYREQSLAGVEWAEPDTASAVRWFRELAGDADLRRRLGAAAQRDARAYVERAARIPWLAEFRSLSRVDDGRP